MVWWGTGGTAAVVAAFSAHSTYTGACALLLLFIYNRISAIFAVGRDAPYFESVRNPPIYFCDLAISIRTRGLKT